MMFLFRGISRGAMSVVVPISAVGGVALPVLVGVAVLGERPAPLVWTGIVLALPALWSVSSGTTSDAHPSRAPIGDGLISGTGIALQYLALAQAGPESGIWPVVAGRVTAVITVAVVSSTLRPAGPRPESDHAARHTGIAVTSGFAGVLAGLALVSYLLATRTELVAVAVVLSSLYPVIPVALGIAVLRERLTWSQTSGLIAALAGGRIDRYSLNGTCPHTTVTRWPMATTNAYPAEQLLPHPAIRSRSTSGRFCA
jgi:drug/metabolite transporter (DMT)-like permease